MMPLLLELHRAPQLWDQNPARRQYEGTPHAAMRDIWVRFRPAEELTGPDAFWGEYRCVFWPAWHELPSLRPMVFALMSKVSAVELGSILITRLPPGGEILAHSDQGGWGPGWFNCKCHLTVAGSSESMCDGETVTMRTGDIFTFDNLLVHSVKNAGDCDRIVCIVSMRCEP
jgi:hypothetical protein